MKKLLLSGLLAFSLFAMGACGDDSSNTDIDANVDGSESVELVEMSVGILAIADSYPFQVAVDEGLFEKYGLDVTIHTFSSASDKELAFETGEIDANMTDLVVTALLEASGTDVVVTGTALGAITEEGRFLVLSSPDSGIETIDDLRGVTVGVGDNTIVHYLAEILMEDAGFSDDEIVTINIPNLGLRMETMMAGTDLQVAVLPDPLASYAVALGANIIVDDTTLDENLTQSVVIFHQAIVDEQASDVENFMNAYFEAMELINANPDVYGEAAMEFASVADILKDDYPIQTYTANSVPTEYQVNAVLEWMIDYGSLSEMIDYSDIVTTDFID